MTEHAKSDFAYRLAVRADVAAIRPLMDASISSLLAPYLPPEGVEASFDIMGLDTQLIDDGTYYVVTQGDVVVGCGGWSRRSTLFGGDHSAGRDAALLDPATEPARVRAMYTHPDFARRGVGRLILRLCEDAARAEGFKRLELMATMSGRALYVPSGYTDIEAIEDSRGGAPVPLVRMGKAIPVL